MSCKQLLEVFVWSGTLSEEIEEVEPRVGAFSEDCTYDLFISYRRSDAASHAIALRRWLKKYRLPASLQTKDRNRNLEIYLDEINVRAKSDFMEEIVPALGQSRYLLIINSKDAHQLTQDGGPNWLVRELRVFRSKHNPRRDQIVAAVLDANFDAELPDGLGEDLPRIERLDLRELTSRWQWWPPKRLRIEGELLPLIATLRDIEPEEMETLRREAERASTNRLVAMLSSTLATIAVLAVALIWAIASQIESTRSNFEAQFAQMEANRSAADAIVINASVARQSGNHLGSLRLLAEAQSLAWTERVQAAVMSLDEPLAAFDHAVEFPAWRTAFSTEGKLALGGIDGSVVLYDPDEGAQVPIRQPDGIPVVGLAFDPSGDLLVVLRSPADAAWNGAIESMSRLERISTSGNVVDLGLPPSGAAWLSIAISANQKLIVAGADDGVWLYDSKKRDWGHLGGADGDRGQYGPVSVAVSAKGDYVAASTVLGDITVWRTSDPDVVGRWDSPVPRGTVPYNPFELVFAEPGPELVFGSFDGSLHRWNFASLAVPTVIGTPHEQAVTSVALTSDGRLLATGGWDATAAVMDSTLAETAQRLSVGPEGLRAGVMDISLSPDGTWLATTEAVPMSGGHAGGTPGDWLFGSVRLWHFREVEEPSPATEYPWWAVGFDSAGGFLTARVERSTNLIREGQPLKPLATAGSVWDPIVESQRHRLVIRDLRVDGFQASFGDHSSIPFDRPPAETVTGSISFSPSGERAAFLSAKVNQAGTSLLNPEIILIDVATGEVIQRKGLPLAATRAFGPLEFMDDQTVIASLIATADAPDAQLGSSVWYWDTSSDLAQRVFTLRVGVIFDLAVSGVNRMVALSDDDRSIIVFDLLGKEIWRADAERRLTNAPALLAFTPNGQALLVASYSQLHRFQISDGWKETQGSVDIQFKPEDIEVDPTGRLLVVADRGGALRFIDATSLEQLLQTELDVGPLLQLSISPDGRRVAAVGIRGGRLLGGTLPDSVATAERISRLTANDGGLVRLNPEDEARLVTQFPSPYLGTRASAEAAKFLWLLRSDGLSLRSPETWVDWLMATTPFSISEEMESWLEANKGHPFSSNLLQWVSP